MALTVTPKADKPGRAAKRPALSIAQKPLVCCVFTVTADASYPNTGAQNTRGYLLDATVAGSPYDLMRVVESIIFDEYMSQGAANDLVAGHIASAYFDPTNKRVRVYDNFVEVANTVNISGVVLTGKAWGYA